MPCLVFDMLMLSLDDERYEKAMRHAACTSLSWTFMYDYACPANDEDLGSCPYVDGHAMGTSIIATGHAGVDGFACYMWYDIFKVYQLTGCEMYKRRRLLYKMRLNYLLIMMEVRTGHIRA